jgi:S-adenosylmethionine uptake transporter
MMSPTLRGSLAAGLGIACITSSDAITKALAAGLPAGQIVALRGVLAIPLVALLAFGLARGGWLAALRPRDWRANALRNGIIAGHSVMVVLSLSVMPLAEALALIFLSPLVALPMAQAWLGERAGWARYGCVALGFCGAALVLAPGGALPGWHALIPLATAVSSALVDITTRYAARTEPALPLLMGTMVGQAVFGAGLSGVTGVVAPTELQWLGLLGCAALMSAFHWFSIMSLRLADVGTIAPLRYFGLVWAAVLGFVFWGDVPLPVTFMGAGLIVLAGVLNLRLSLRRA